MPVTLKGASMFHLLYRACTSEIRISKSETNHLGKTAVVEIRNYFVLDLWIFEHLDLVRNSCFDIRVLFYLLYDSDSLNLDHHLRPCQFLDTDQSTGWVAAFLKKFFAQLSEARAVRHVGDEHGHGDDIVQLAAGFF